MNKLQSILSFNYGCDLCEITTSGSDAIYTIMNVIFIHNLFEKFNIMLSNQVYSSTPKIIKYICDTYSPSCIIHPFDVENSSEILELFNTCKNQNNILFIESCSNSFGKIFDFELIPILKKISNKFYAIVDNTWLTEIIFNPFIFEIDFVVISLTKYYSAGNAIAGAILTKSSELSNPIMSKIITHRKFSGSHISPYTCDIIINKMSNIVSRINKTSKFVIKWFEYCNSNKHRNLNSIIHPYFENHSSHNLMKKYFKQEKIPSVFLITIKKSTRSKIFKNIKKCIIFDCKTSFGADHSRFDPFCFNIDDLSYIRVSIGYNDDLNIIICGINELLDFFDN